MFINETCFLRALDIVADFYNLERNVIYFIYCKRNIEVYTCH